MNYKKKCHDLIDIIFFFNDLQETCNKIKILDDEYDDSFLNKKKDYVNNLISLLKQERPQELKTISGLKLHNVNLPKEIIDRHITN